MSKLKYGFIVFLWMWAIPTLALDWKVDLDPRAGIDYKYWGVRPKPEFEVLFPKISSAVNFYVGTRICRKLAIDLGYEKAPDKTHDTVFTGSETIFNHATTANDYAKADVRLSAFHIDFSGYWNIHDKWELLGIVSLANLKPRGSIIYRQGLVESELPTQFESKWLGRFGFGAEFSPLRNLGIRALVMFDQSSRITIEGFDENGFPFVIKPYKNAATFHIGLVATA